MIFLLGDYELINNLICNALQMRRFVLKSGNEKKMKKPCIQ